MVEEPPMNNRDKILARIREALTVPAPKPGVHGPGGDHGGHAAPEPAFKFGGRPVHVARAWLPPGGDTPDEQLARFAAASAELKTSFQPVSDEAEAHRRLRELAAAEAWTRVGTHRSALTDAACAALGLDTLVTDGGYDPEALERCDVGITLCDALVAQTGSLVVTSRTTGGRALSVLPPHHVVLARRDQLVGDLTDAFRVIAELHGKNWPSMISLVTGPSRTGDIERILVLGAHGPKKLTVFLW
jgi:L-lactate dehydrogenase complex protein LldG